MLFFLYTDFRCEMKNTTLETKSTPHAQTVFLGTIFILGHLSIRRYASSRMYNISNMCYHKPPLEACATYVETIEFINS